VEALAYGGRRQSLQGRSMRRPPPVASTPRPLAARAWALRNNWTSTGRRGRTVSEPTPPHSRRPGSPVPAGRTSHRGGGPGTRQARQVSAAGNAPSYQGLVVHDSWPPLIRAIGSSTLVVATVITAAYEHEQATARAEALPVVAQAARPSDRSGDEPLLGLARAAATPREDQHCHDDLAERVFSNFWFDLFGTVGSAIFAFSFFAEWHVVRSRSRGGSADRRAV